MATESWTFLPERDDLSRLSDDEKIDWLEGRIHRILIMPVREMRRVGRAAQRGLPDPPASHWNLAIATLICSGIEALGHHLHGRKAVRSGSVRDFRGFIDAYMPEFSAVKEEIYGDFRCGLAHSLVTRRGSIEERLSRPFVRDRKGHLRIDLDRFFQCFVTAVESYFITVREDLDLRQRFLDRFNASNRFWIERRARGGR
jgi:hypothetical protein